MQDRGNALKALFQPSFIIAVAILAGAAFGVNPTLLREAGPKAAVPLRKPLGELTKKGIGPYRFVDQIELSSAMVEKLGTEEYIDWQFEDTSIDDAESPLRNVRLTITYYTGGRDLVPHTPDVCMVGAGYTAETVENLDLELPSLQETVPVRVLTFEASMMRKQKPTVAYTFHCNGKFVCTRTGVRLGMNSLSDRHAYFAKIEVVFGGQTLAPRDDAIEATRKFLDHLLPVLLRDHLPDWAAVKRAEAAADVAAN